MNTLMTIFLLVTFVGTLVVLHKVGMHILRGGFTELQPAQSTTSSTEGTVSTPLVPIVPSVAHHINGQRA